MLFFFGLQDAFTGEGYSLDYVNQFISLYLTVKSSDSTVEQVLVPMRKCRKEDFARVRNTMFYDLQVMSLGSPEALACPDFEGVEQFANLMLPRYEIIQFLLSDCDGENCASSEDKEAFLSRF